MFSRKSLYPDAGSEADGLKRGRCTCWSRGELQLTRRALRRRTCGASVLLLPARWSTGFRAQPQVDLMCATLGEIGAAGLDDLTRTSR